LIRSNWKNHGLETWYLSIVSWFSCPFVLQNGGNQACPASSTSGRGRHINPFGGLSIVSAPMHSPIIILLAAYRFSSLPWPSLVPYCFTIVLYFITVLVSAIPIRRGDGMAWICHLALSEISNWPILWEGSVGWGEKMAKCLQENWRSVDHRVIGWAATSSAKLPMIRSLNRLRLIGKFEWFNRITIHGTDHDAHFISHKE
jgi:hypothetical protein